MCSAQKGDKPMRARVLPVCDNENFSELVAILVDLKQN